MNLQYSQFITRTVFCGDHVRQMIHANLDQIEEGSDVDDKIVVSRFFALKGAKVTSWCGDREKFLGRYHGYGNPAGVAEGTLCNEGNENGNSCGALSTVVRLAPGEHCEFAFLVGMKEEPEVAEILASLCAAGAGLWKGIAAADRLLAWKACTFSDKDTE